MTGKGWRRTGKGLRRTAEEETHRIKVNLKQDNEKKSFPQITQINEEKESAEISEIYRREKRKVSRR